VDGGAKPAHEEGIV